MQYALEWEDPRTATDDESLWICFRLQLKFLGIQVHFSSTSIYGSLAEAIAAQWIALECLI